MATRVLVLNGPNLNMLGIREPEVYGRADYVALVETIRCGAKERDIEVSFFQSNCEGQLIDRIQQAYFEGMNGIIINPGAYTHYSYAIHDALKTFFEPKIEVHLSDIHSREEFRKVSVTAPACDEQICGKGFAGYLLAMDRILEIRRAREEEAK